MNRTIWQYWETVDVKPPFVDGFHGLACRNAGVEVIRVTPETLADYLPDLPPEVNRIGNVAHKSDMIRTLLIHKFGGMWLDSDALVLKDLNWLFDFLADYEFVGFNDRAYPWKTPGGVRINCFLARPGSDIVGQWVAAQHGKFPRTEYAWTEIGTDIIDGICKANGGRVKILDFEQICPVPARRVGRFRSEIRSSRRWIDKIQIVMLSNMAMKQRGLDVRMYDMDRMRMGNSMLAQFVNRACDAGYRPPSQFTLFWRKALGSAARRLSDQPT
ncbi:MAG: hypothetical protein H6906_03050 [Hyphomicrobiales bacterium]|nr:hypothetical protein [Hyphomicrobiales bacterium]